MSSHCHHCIAVPEYIAFQNDITTLCHGSTFHNIDSLLEESTGYGGFPSQKVINVVLWWGLVVNLNKLLNKQSSCLWLFIQCHCNGYVDGLVQERRNFIANALELYLSCTNPSMWWWWRLVITGSTRDNATNSAAADEMLSLLQASCYSSLIGPWEISKKV